MKVKIALITLFAVYFSLMGFFGSGCSSGNNQNPINPNFDSNQHSILKPHSIDSIPIALADYLPDGSTTGVGVLGIFDVSIDTSNLTSQVTGLRKSAAIGDSFIVDITNFLTITPCTDCLKIESLEITTDGYLKILFLIRHPFQHGTLDKPPSAKNRLDLHVFDVFGELYFTGTFLSYPMLEQTVGPVKLINADGYNGYFDSRIDNILSTEATIHPYMLMSYDASEGNFSPSNPFGFEPINAPTGHNVFKMGGNLASYFLIDFSGLELVNFLMVITASYGQSATATTRLAPKYYLPEFNRKEAWKVRVTIDQNTLFEGDKSSYCDLKIDVWDWNHGVTVDPSLSSFNVIRAPSDVQSVEIEMPGVLLTPQTANGPISGNGRTSPLRYTARIYNEIGGGPGYRWGLVKVKDSRLPGGNAGGIGDGVDRDGKTFFNLNEFSTYQIFKVEVHKAAPVCIINVEPNPPIIHPNESVALDASGSYDYDGSIVSYEWDYDYNGSVFNVDATGVIPIPPPPKFDNNHNVYNQTVTIALRVTDNNSPVPYTTICTLDITVLPNRDPTAVCVTSVNPVVVKKNGLVEFDATGSYDIDGDTLTYQWDWNYQGGVFTVDDTGPIVSHYFNEAFCGYAALRVLDQGLPTPRYDIYLIDVLVLPIFKPLDEKEIDATMTERRAGHDLYASVVATDPNTNDVYIAYYGLTGTSIDRIRCQRSNDGGATWSAPQIVNGGPTTSEDANSSGIRGIALIVVPNSIPGQVYCFWIGDGSNSSSQQSDGWNIRYNRGLPSTTNNTVAWDTSWHQDITMYSLSDGSTWNAPYEYKLNYYVYSQPSNIAAVADLYTPNVVYLAYVETSYNSNCGESVRLIKTTDIQNYPASVWMPLTQTQHVDSSGGFTDVPDYSGVDINIDSSHNVYVVWDDNINGALKIRKYPFGLAPGNTAQIIKSDPVRTNLSNPRIAIGLNNTPVVVFNDTNFAGGVSGVTDIVLSYGTNSIPSMSTPMLVNTPSSRSTNKKDPDVVIDKNCGTVYVFYQDYRHNASKGEIFWTILNKDYQIIQTDELVNMLDNTHSLDDFDVHACISQPYSSSDTKIIITWEQEVEDTWITRAY